MTDMPHATNDNMASAAAQNHSLPPAAFANEAFFSWEQNNLINHGWNCVARTDHLPDVGDYRTFELASMPLILIRDGRQTLRVFSNVCRHRGMILAEGEGNCRRLQCPFHGWTYDLDGNLIAAAMMDQTKGFNKNDFGLIEIPIETVDGFVFINPAKSATPVKQMLGDFQKVHAPWNLEDMVTTRRKRFEVRCNWKLFVQVFMEYYHLPLVHRQTLGEIQYQPADEEVFNTGNYVSLFGLHEGTGAVLETDRTQTFGSIPGLDDRQSRGSRYTQMFPSLIMCCTRDCMWFYECYPVSTNESVFYMNSCFPKRTVERDDFEDIARAYYERWDIALAEDIEVLEKQQRGMSSPLATTTRYSWMESGVALFEQWIDDQVSVDDEAMQLLAGDG